MWRQLCFALLLAVMMKSACAKTQLKDIDDKVTSTEADVKDIKQKILRLDDLFTQLTDIGAAVNALPSTIENKMDLHLEKILDRIDEKCTGTRSDKRLITDDEGYLLAFRVTAGIKTSMYKKYMAVGQNDDSNDLLFSLVPCGCKTTNGSLPCDRHYRSVLLDHMPVLPVDKVRVAVYKEGVEKMRMIFDGRKRDYLNFFKQSQLLEDPYTDLSSTTPDHPNFFSIPGHVDRANSRRRFFINNFYRGCPNDKGWLEVGDTAGPSSCLWEKRHQAHFPYILYANTPSKNPTKTEGYVETNWQKQNPGVGDVLTVSIKLRSSGC